MKRNGNGTLNNKKPSTPSRMLFCYGSYLSPQLFWLVRSYSYLFPLPCANAPPPYAHPLQSLTLCFFLSLTCLPCILVLPGLSNPVSFHGKTILMNQAPGQLRTHPYLYEPIYTEDELEEENELPEMNMWAASSAYVVSPLHHKAKYSFIIT